MHDSVQPDPVTQQLWARLNGVCEQLWGPLQQQLAQQVGREGLSMEVVGSIDSTNSELMRRARMGQTDPMVLVAIDQTAGRGRMGKSWHSTVGACLTFSVGLPLRPSDWSGLSLAVGVSVAESLTGLLARQVADANAQTPPSVQLKWPNDLWVGGKKLSGILVETANAGGNRFVVIGIGINITPPAHLPASAPVSAGASNGHASLPPAQPTGLAALVPTLDAADALAAVLPALWADLLTFEARGFAAFAPRFAARDALAGQPLVLSDGMHGTGCGVDATGALQVLMAQGVRSVNSAEVSVRPAIAGVTGQPC